jgi:hypothetical protein
MFGRPKTPSIEAISKNTNRAVRNIASRPMTEESAAKVSRRLTSSVNAAAKRGRRNGKDDSTS